MICMLDLNPDSGQSILEYVMAVLLIMVVLVALVTVLGDYKQTSVTDDSMLGKTITSAPFTGQSSLGSSSQGVLDVLAH